MRFAASFVATATATFLLGCGGGSSGTGTDGRVVQGSIDHGVISVPVSLEGAATMPFVVDTGSPLMLVDPNKFPTLNLPSGLSTASTVDIGAIHLTDVTILAASPCGMMVCTGTQPAGLLGGDVLVGFALTLDYAKAAVGFGVSTNPTGIGAPVTTPFVLAGGAAVSPTGADGGLSQPPTRITISVTIEGTVHPFVLDTGSSPVVLRPEVYDSIVADGRPQTTVSISTVTGTQTQPATSLSSVSLAGANESNVEAVRSPVNLDLLSVEVGHTVDGLLGGAYLQHFVVKIDYPAQQITLSPYTAQ
jgi:hypothetical protein